MAETDHQAPLGDREARADERRATVDDKSTHSGRISDPRHLVAVLADTAKLRVFAALTLTGAEGATVGAVAEAADVTLAEATKALANLCAIGLAERDGEKFTATPGVFRASLTELNRRRDEAAAAAFYTSEPGKVAVLLNSFRDGKLSYLPEKFGKRMIVLEQLAQSFEPGVRYAEAEVNAVLQEFYPDYAALRRYLVDSCLLTREDGYYWRTGGTVRV